MVKILITFSEYPPLVYRYNFDLKNFKVFYYLKYMCKADLSYSCHSFVHRDCRIYEHNELCENMMTILIKDIC